ncbi:MAG: prepilin-type N-terminal cleavage/methylation domain-containing protein [Pseudomonadota bacterium]|nr:prepilin-type N-terminal cleavage/methylation domain-containing protein [Pseudomonadota bacterium]
MPYSGFRRPPPTPCCRRASRARTRFVSHRASQGGFSLLEVVVAFSILALTLGLLLQIFSRALNTTALSGTYSRAATLAEAELNAVGIDYPLEAGSHSGESEDGFEWEVFVDPYDLGDLGLEVPVAPYSVTAVVSWPDSGGRRQITLTTLRLGEQL